MRHVTCTLVEKTNTVMVWREGELVGMVTEVGGEPQLTIYGVSNKPLVLSFNDLEIIEDNWNALQEMRGREERRRKIYKNGIDSGEGV